MTGKFIHHSIWSARFANPEGEGAGHFDVLEDESGVYVSNEDSGILHRVKNINEGDEIAQDLIDKFDAEFLAGIPHASITLTAATADFVLRYLPSEAECSPAELIELRTIRGLLVSAFSELEG